MRLALIDRAARAPSLSRVVIGVALLLIAIGTIVALSAYWRVRQTPVWWKPLDNNGAETVALAESVERGVINTIHKGRDGEAPWTVAVSPEQANAWLNAKMPKWLANRRIAWPRGVEQIQTAFAPGRIVLGARIRANDSTQIVAATVIPALKKDGSLWMPISAARAGRLDLPTEWTVRQLRDWLPPEVRERESTRAVLDALTGAAALFEDATIRLEDGRRVRVIEITPEEGRLLLTCVTEPG